MEMALEAREWHILAATQHMPIISSLLYGVTNAKRAPKAVIPVQEMISVQYQWPARLPKPISKQAPATSPTFGGRVSKSSVLRDVVGPR
jgi:hypothetical protein